MENNNMGEAAWEGAAQPNDWQYEIINENQWDHCTDEYNSFDLRSAEANGYGTELDQYVAKSDDEGTMINWGNHRSAEGKVPSASGSVV